MTWKWPVLSFTIVPVDVVPSPQLMVALKALVPRAVFMTVNVATVPVARRPSFPVKVVPLAMIVSGMTTTTRLVSVTTVGVEVSWSIVIVGE